MGYSDSRYQENRLSIERQKLDVEKLKTDALMDIRDVMLMQSLILGLEIEKRAKGEYYDSEDIKRVSNSLEEIRRRIEERTHNDD